MGEEDCGDFPSAFICLPAFFFFPRNYKHVDEHSLRLRHVTLHVIAVVAGSETSLAQVCDYGRNETS